ncbi:MAG: hypothetical protein OJF59_001074 [Cytophagales bacterium]|jgi:hypothetical protein|nr:DUF2911 domain-containing protein [Bacteroidota bacterium]MBS1979933.1 DUF2911 domain-containing protein [Bacteroidota bacterium]WHZ07321.1 MAG: hypothetical protein OJF59_001074 [Cytophagales bacterium]
MKKILIISGIAVVTLAIGLAVYFKTVVKSKSPEDRFDYSNGNLKITIHYNRPSKRGREIFGKLVPFGKTWRTGANETTTFESTQDLKFGDKILKAGKYSLWTVPNEKTWQVIFNSKIPSWGVNFDGVASRDSTYDVLAQEVPAVVQNKIFEQLTISIENVSDGAELIIIWDKTLVAVPFTLN